MMEKKWEQRRYEIAKDVMTACVNNNEMFCNNTERTLAKWSVVVADILIEELKEKNKQRLQRRANVLYRLRKKRH